mgnify:FL=1|tara:strand:- start:11437 stop:12237 length:801 start_codon:yes stop_codon:yes gene_type:complete
MATYESKKYNFSGANITSISATGIADGSVDNTEYQFINSLSSNAQTQITGRLQTAGGTMTGSILFPDSTGPAPARIQMGAGTDMKMFSDGTYGVAAVLNGFFVVNNDSSETLLSAFPDGAVNLYHNNIGRLETQSGGCQITGALGVGTTSVGATAGELRAADEITAYYSSDERLKENITTIEDALDKVNAIRGVEFDWKADHIKKRGGEDGYFVRKHDVGILAQDVKKVCPEVVAEKEDGTLGVKYEKLIGLLVQAINELSAKVNK